MAATGSYLDARQAGGRWLVRLDDLDTARNIPGADATILQTLHAFGFHIDGEIVRQSSRLALYEATLERLGRAGMLFNCHCSRRAIAAAGLGEEPRCVGDCRTSAPGWGARPDAGSDASDRATAGAVRVALDRLSPSQVLDRSGRVIQFDPRLQTDVVVRRRDGVIAYQLAVVVDDATQGVSDVVRGGDLLPSTAWQLGLQQALALPTPRYLHLPVVVEPGGAKLAKSRHALPLDAAAAPALLARALALLGQAPPCPGAAGDLEAIWAGAIERWDPAAASRRAEVCA